VRKHSIGIQILKNAVLAPPAARHAYQRRRLRHGYDTTKDEPEYPRRVFEFHRDAVARHRSVSGRMMEIGPGGNVAVAAQFVQAGCESAVCLDTQPWNAAAQDLYEALGVGDVFSRVDYRWPVAIETADLESASLDIVVSHAAYEHFDDPDGATANVARMLAPDGVVSHQIDLRDHNNFDDPLRFLRYSDRVWRLASSNRLLTTNRWRVSEIVAAHKRAGLDVLEVTPTMTVELTEDIRGRFWGRFRELSLEELGILGVHLVARRAA
jgi:SAM-dependent methyltransferase